MTWWFKQPADFYDQPKMVAAGERASTLFIRIVGLAEQHGAGDELPAEYLTASYLAARFRRGVDETDEDLAALISTDLLTLADDVVIVDRSWDPPPDSSAVRQRRYRQRHAGSPVTNVTTSDAPLRDVTKVTVPVTVTHQIRPDQIRPDQIRETLVSTTNVAEVVTGHELVISYLNSRARRDLTAKAHRKQVDKQLKRHSVDDLCLVVDFKVAEWLGTDMAKYLRPATLFQEAKFSGYLDEASEWDRAGRPPARASPSNGKIDWGSMRRQMEKAEGGQT